MIGEPLFCKRCDVETPKTSPMQIYCPPCSIFLDNERKYKRKTTKNPTSLKSQLERQRLEKRGTQLSLEQRRGMDWPVTCEDDLISLIRVAMPFTWELSKNRIWSLGSSRGHVFLRAASKRARDHLEELIRYNAKDTRFYTGKVWIDIFVQKPNNKGDAINLIDSICDAVKTAIGIDDRYFSIRKLDWQIMKKNPMLFVGIGQSITEDHFFCAYCGRERPLTDRSSQKRTCKECRFQEKFDARNKT